MKITICIIMGLPAVGKTTVTKMLASALTEERIHWSVFSFDDIMPDVIDFDEILHKNIMANQGSNMRKNLSKEKMVDLSANTWKEHRKAVYDLIETYLKFLINRGQKVELKNITKNCSCLYNEFPSPESRQHVVLVDDNMFYRSMRYVLYRFARKYECSFCQIFLRDNVNDLVLRNKDRENKGIVTEDTILKMAKSYEYPDPRKFYWEKNTFEFEKLSMTNLKDAIQKLVSIIRTLSEDIVPPLESEEERAMKESCRKEIMESYLHQCDQVLRKFISTKMSEEKSRGQDKTHMKNTARDLNEKRKGYLELMRKNKDNITETLSSSMAGDWNLIEIQNFEKYIT